MSKVQIFASELGAGMTLANGNTVISVTQYLYDSLLRMLSQTVPFMTFGVSSL